MAKKILGNKLKLRVIQLRPVKLKDKEGRNRLVVNFQEMFQFMPDILIIDKVHGKSNTIIVSAVLPVEDAKKDRKKRIRKKA